MPLDLFGSARATIVMMLVGASFSSPFIAQSGAFGAVRGAVGGSEPAHAEPTERLVAGGMEFAAPADWARLSPQAAAASSSGLGTVVASACPAGGAGATCTKDVQLSFVAYSGEGREAMPAYAALERQFDRQLAQRFRGFSKVYGDVRPTADGHEYLRYEFSYRDGTSQRYEVLAAYRHDDSSGVVAVGEGPADAMKQHGGEIDSFLDGAAASSAGSDH